MAFDTGDYFPYYPIVICEKNEEVALSVDSIFEIYVDRSRATERLFIELLSSH